MPAPLLAALALLAAPADPPYNWGADTDSYTQGREFAGSKAVCRRLGAPRPPPADLPTPAQRPGLKGCDAETLYYGEGARPDYVRARQCAFTQPADDEVFGGATILMQVYANGLGVAKDLDLATAYACTIQGAPFELKGRVDHLQSLKARPEKGRFDVCDDITSGLMQGHCQRRRSTIADRVRDGRLAALVARLPPSAKPLYPPLKRAFDAFLGAHGGGEVDLSGTARAAQTFEEEDTVKDAFLKRLGQLTSGRWPLATPAEARAADAGMNAAYRKTLAAAAGKDNLTTIKPDDIRKAQRAWLAWRDAYVRFARAAAPGVSAEAVLAELTGDRTAQLDGMVG